MAIQILFKGDRPEDVARFIRVFPNNIVKEVNKEQFEFMKRVQKSAKLRAPRFTGTLASSINTKQMGKNQVILTVGAPYGMKQETGEGLPTWERFFRYASKTRGQRFQKSGSAGKKPGKGYKFVSHYKPFIAPALGAELQKLPNRLSNSVDKGIRRSK